MELTLVKMKETPGTFMFSDSDNHNIYLKKPEVNALGNPEKIKITIVAV
jgi:hypothetical protein